MARRRKEVSKSKSSVRKTMCDNTNAVEGDSKLKDDPGGGPQAMDEIKYLSDIKNQSNNQTEISQQNHDNHHHPKHYNSNTHVSDLKYLHKKFKRIASATVVDNINTPVIDSRPTNSNELKSSTCSQPEYKQDVADQPNDEFQLNNILEQQQFNRLNIRRDMLDEKLEVSIQHKTLHKENQKKISQPVTTVLNGFSSSNCNDSRSIEPVNSYKEKMRFNANGSPIVAVSNDKFNNFAQLDVANINNSPKQSANAIVNCSSINSVNTTKTYLIPVETPFQQKSQDIAKLSILDVNQQISGSHTPPTISYQSSLMGKSTPFTNYPLKSPTHHYQSVVDVRTAPSTINSTPIIHAPTQSKMQYQQLHTDSASSHTPGRYVCPYCQLNCTKPSVLQKHIRAHTNERPFPCDVCGFAFKTRSNLYKHCRSRAHALRMQGGEPQPDDDVSLGGSDQDQDQELSSSASSDVISGTASPTEDRVSSPSSHQIERPYKPKFHNAALYTADDQQKQKLSQQQQIQNLNQSPTGQTIIRSQHIIEMKASECAKMLVVLQSGEQRMIAFTSRKERCTVQELLKRVGVPFTDHTNIECVTNPGVGIDYLVTVGVACSGTPSEIISAAESTLQLKQQQLLQQQQHQQQPTTSAVTTSGAISISHPLSTQNVEYLKERISKIISENETIMEVVEAPLKKKYRKITGISRGVVINENPSNKSTVALLKREREESQNSANNNVTAASVQQSNTSTTVSSSLNVRSILPTLQQQAEHVLQTSQQFSLNLTKIFDANENQRKRRFSEGIPTGQEVATHPQNPERSIIKDLLLNSRGLAIPTGEGDEAVYTCPLCKITFRSADNLQYHTKCYCQGSPASTPQSAPISPVGSPSHKYFRSNSFNVNLPEKYNPNTLAKLASSTLRHPNKTPLSLAKLAQTKIKPGRSKPENIVINKDTCPAPIPLPTQSITVQCAPIAKLIDAPLPSPGPLLGKTRLVDTYNSDRMTEEAIISHFTSERDASAQAYNMKSFATDDKYRDKRSRVDSYSMNSPVFLTSMEQLASPNSRLLQMCGGDLKIVERREETLPKFGSSGGSIVSISPPSDCHTPEPFGIRSGLLSGGGAVDADISSTVGYVITPTLTPKHGSGQLTGQYFQFPPISPIITGYNPLTLPPVHPTSIVHGGRIIPHVPGIPGPNSLSPRPVSPLKRNPSPTNRRMVPSPLTLTSTNAMMSITNITTPKFSIPSTTQVHKTLVSRTIPNIKIDDSDEKTKKTGRNGIIESNFMSSITSVKPEIKRLFNFSRIAENVSPRNDMKKVMQEPIDADVRYFNFDNVITKAEIKASHTSPLHIDVTTSPSLQSNRAEEMPTLNEPPKSTKFLRPSSLPLKPGTFTPKRHHGITPTANTLPLISPETPRPSKSCVQLYLNGHAYTYLGLKCSTKTFYCTVNRPQPVHFTNQHKLSIYSNWQICAESDPHPLGLSPKNTMSLYDSRQRPLKYTMANTSQTCTTLHSQSLIVTPFDNNKLLSANDNSSLNRSAVTSKSEASTAVPAVSGGYESNEVYTYVRGRGRGRYVCSECGIRCKKPSMLKKHIRTHSDVRPFTCRHCQFSFKTKGNLTKHMKSKAHYKKCEELGLTPLPPSADDDGADDDTEGASMTSGDHTSTVPDDSDTDDLSDGEDGENDSSDTSESKMRLPEHEAAKCLLYLSQTPPGNTSMPNLIPARPMTYPYGDQSSQMLALPTSDSPSARRVISFQTTTPFEYSPKHDQYYANPKVSVMSQKFEDSNSMPIDLTKPRDSLQSIQQVHSSVQQNSSHVDGILKGPTGFLTTLVSNTDKLLTQHQLVLPMADENAFMQTYLTERALQDTKIKQMYRHQAITSTSNSVMSKVAISESENRRPSVTTSFDKQTFTVNTITVVTSSSVTLSSDSKIQQIMSTGQPVMEKVIVNSQNGNSRDFVENRFGNDDNTSGMDTLAEIAASSVKLDITQSRIKVVDAENLNVPSGQQSNSAKSVASEYLKMTSAEFMKAHQYKSDREESDESGESDDESGVIKPPDFAGVLGRKIVGDDGFKGNAPDYNVQLIQEDGRSACSICHKTFPKPSQVKLHMNIHYMERKFRCEPCAVSFRTQGHLQKHERSEQHKNKVLMTSTFGNVTTSNPRPFECSDCNIAFRIHGHLAKHLRSKTHVQKLECLQKLPFGTYAEIERAGISLTDIDTTDCHNSLASLKVLAQRLLDKDPSKLSSWSHGGDEQHVRNFTNESRESNSDGEPICSPDDESDCRTSDREGGGVSMSENSIAASAAKRKSEMNGINELNESGVENHEKRLKIFSDT